MRGATKTHKAQNRYYWVILGGGARREFHQVGFSTDGCKRLCWFHLKLLLDM